jgi:hypothetical protein
VLDEPLDRLGMAFNRGIHQGRDAMIVLSINVARHGQDTKNLLCIAVIGCPHEVSLTDV